MNCKFCFSDLKMAKEPQEGKIEYGASIGGLVDQLTNININSGDKEQVKETIPAWLENCESPFLWHSEAPRALSSEHIIELCLEKLDELCLAETEFSLRRYILNTNSNSLLTLKIT